MVFGFRQLSRSSKTFGRRENEQKEAENKMAGPEGIYRYLKKKAAGLLPYAADGLIVWLHGKIPVP